METEKEKQLKKVIRITYTVLYWIALFLFLPTITRYVLTDGTLKNILAIAKDIGIIILMFWAWKIKRRMKKKQKEEEKEKK